MQNVKNLPSKIEKQKTLRFTLYALRSQEGFSILELIAIMSIMVILVGFATLNLIHAQNSTTITSTTNALIADMKSQQIKAMENDTEGRSASDSYGIHFSSSQYVLFHGSSYNAGDSTNLPITIDAGIQFTNNTFPSGNVIFAQGSGEVASYSATKNTITLQTPDGLQQKTITINQYGVVTGVQ